MTGRNNKPKNNGPASSPSRLDQFGEKMAEDSDSKDMKQNKSNGKC
jgi:hypothetical protein